MTLSTAHCKSVGRLLLYSLAKKNHEKGAECSDFIKVDFCRPTLTLPYF